MTIRRVLDWSMAALFALAAIVQVNDPDPIPWMTVYGIAAVISALIAAGRSIPATVLLAVSLPALAWAVAILASGPAVDGYFQMFEAWEMQSQAVEEAREASGLLIVAVWMGVLALRSSQ